MKKRLYRVVAFQTTRHELDILAESEEEARSKADDVEVVGWEEDPDFYDFTIECVEVVGEEDAE